MAILHSKIIGKGEPLLILHGFLGMLDNWNTLGGQYAAQGLEVHLIDQRNHGKSFWSEDFNYNYLAQDVYQYILHHRLSKTLVLGHSMGGKTAMMLACDHSDVVDKLIVADIGPKEYPPHHKDILEAINSLSPEHLTSRGAADEALATRIKDNGIRQFLLKNLYRQNKDQLAFRFNLPVLRNKNDEVGEAIGASAVFHGPTLFLRGDRSEYISDKDLIDIQRHFPSAHLKTIANAGHWLHAENPEQFFDESMNFINER